MSLRRNALLLQPFVRANLVMGGDRELVLCNLIAAVTMGGVTLTWYGFVVGVVLLIGGTIAFREMAKADPWMRKIYLRHIKYRRYYPPRSTPW